VKNKIERNLTTKKIYRATQALNNEMIKKYNVIFLLHDNL